MPVISSSFSNKILIRPVFNGYWSGVDIQVSRLKLIHQLRNFNNYRDTIKRYEPHNSSIHSNKRVTFDS